MRSNWASGSLDDSSEGALYHSAEPSAAAAHVLPRRSSSKIIDFALAHRASTSSASGFGGGACPLLSTSFDSEFDLNTELMAHKGAFRDALTLRDEQLLLRLKQKQRELKQMEAALIKKHEEYHLLKNELEARKKRRGDGQSNEAGDEETPETDVLSSSLSPTDSEAARNLQVFHRLTTAPRRNLSDEISPGLLPTNPTGDGLNLDPSEAKSAEDKQALEMFRPSEPEVFSCGSNRNGTLGYSSNYGQPNTDTTKQGEEGWDIEFFPRCIKGLLGKRIFQVEASTGMAGALTEEGEVYTWGRITSKGVPILGHGPYNGDPCIILQPTPRRVNALSHVKITQLALGQHHAICLASDGKVYSWGVNDKGQCGTGDCMNRDSPVPTKDAFGGPVVQIACGGQHSACLNPSGQLFTFGSGEFGQLGLGDLQHHSYPRQISSVTQPIKAVSCGNRHTTFVTVGSEVFTCGDGPALGLSGGVLATPQYIRLLRGKSISGISCGSWLTAALTETGDVYIWGHLSFSNPQQEKPTRRSTTDDLSARREKGDEAALSPRKASSPSKPGAVGEVIPRLLKIDGLHTQSVRYVACGGRHIACVTDSGRVMCFGSNSHGQLGMGVGDASADAHTDSSPLRPMQSLTPPSDRSRKYSLDDFKKNGSGGGSGGSGGQPKGSVEREHTSDLSFLHEKGKPSDRQGESGGGAEEQEQEQEQEMSGETTQSSTGSPRKRSPEDRERRRIMVAKKLRKVRLVACGENTTMVLLDEYRSNRDRVVWDLLQSERGYVRILNIIVQIYYRPLCQRVQESKSFLFSEKLISMEEVEKIFGNVEQLLDFQRSLLNKLDSCMASWPNQLLGDIFLNMKELLPLYTRYCAGTANAISILNNAFTNRSLVSFLLECMREAEVYRKKEDEKKEFTLSSLLLEPTVRIHKYLSYFREILAYTPKDHPDYENLDSVSIHLRQIVKKLTDDQCQHEYMRLVAKIRGLKQLMQPSRIYVSQTYVTPLGEPTKNPPCSLLLYNDLLCFCSSLALEYEMPLHTVWIQSDPPDVEDPARTFAVISVERTFLMRANSEHERLAFVNNAHSKIAKLLGQSELDNNRRTFKYSFLTGAVYEGQWMWGKFHGMGTYDKNGEKYEGEWVNGQRDGYGTYYNRKGGRYEGCWRNGKREGQGTQHFTKGSGYDKFIGSWVNDKRHDEGYLYFENGDVFFATWDNGLLLLPCSVLYVNGDKYVGDWSGKAPHGYGIYTYTKTLDRFYGTFNAGLRSGNGFLRTGDGTIYNGEWFNDRIHGRGFVLLPDRYVLDAKVLDGDNLDKLAVTNATWMKSVPRDIDELNIERWNYFITLKYVRDPKNLAAKLLDDNLKKAVEDADLSESAVIECVKSMLGSASAHPLGGVVAAFAKLLNRNYRPAEDCYKFFDDAIDDTHSFIEAMVQMVKKSCPRMGEIEETTDWCTSAVESIVFPLIFTTLFAMYEIKNEKEDGEVEAKLEELRRMPLAQQLSLLDLNLDSKQVAEMVEMERSKRKEQEANDKASENDQDGPKQESVSWRRHRLLNSTRDVALLPFQGAIDVMSKVARLNTPADKLHHIYLASKEIERCMPASEEESEGMSADELLPVLAFILVQACIPNLLSELNFLEEFLSKHLRFEVEGYLLTHLHVALQFLKSLDLGREKRRWDEEQKRWRRHSDNDQTRSSSVGLRFSLPGTRQRTPAQDVP